MRAAAIAGAVFAAFIGVMYLRFAGDDVPPPQAPASPGAEVRGPCVVALRADEPDPVPTPAGGRAPCATPSPRSGPSPTARTLAPRQPVNPFLPPTPGVYTGPRPTALETVPLMTGVLSGEADVPEGTAFLLDTPLCEQGCPGQLLHRVFRRATGSYRDDSLLGVREAFPAGVDLPAEDNGHRPVVLHLISTVDSGEVVATICSQSCDFGHAVEGGIGIRLFSSVDGGVTWSEIGTLTTPEYPAGIASVDGSRDILIAGGLEGEPSYRWLRAAKEVIPPAPGAHPIFLSDGRLLWGAPDGRLLWPDGTVFAITGDASEFADTAVVNQDGQMAIALQWRSGPAASGASNFTVLFDANGTPIRGIALNYQFVPVAWWDEHKVIGTRGDASTAAQVVTYDLTSGVGELISSVPLSVGNINSRLLSVQHGPFVVVRFTDGSCLNIRSQPGPQSTVVDCLPDAALLRDLSDTRVIGTVAWLRVQTPTGVEGWASTEYLEARRP